MPLNQDNIWLTRGVVEGHAEQSLQNASVIDDIAGASHLILCHLLDVKKAATEMSTNSPGKWFWTQYLKFLKKISLKYF